jgi:hypothetical protein
MPKHPHRRDHRSSRRLPTAAVTGLDRRALDVSVRAVHAAITQLWLQQRATPRAIVEILARVRGHGFLLPMAAGRALDRGLENGLLHRPRTQTNKSRS